MAGHEGHDRGKVSHVSHNKSHSPPDEFRSNTSTSIDIDIDSADKRHPIGIKYKTAVKAKTHSFRALKAAQGIQ